MADLFWFSDEQWALIEPLLPTKSRGVRRVDDRRVLSGIVHVLKSGGRWSDAPPKKTLYNRFARWADKGRLGAYLPVAGRPWAIVVTPGNIPDVAVARQCIEALPPTQELVADKGADKRGRTPTPYATGWPREAP